MEYIYKAPPISKSNLGKNDYVWFFTFLTIELLYY